MAVIFYTWLKAGFRTTLTHSCSVQSLILYIKACMYTYTETSSHFLHLSLFRSSLLATKNDMAIYRTYKTIKVCKHQNTHAIKIHKGLCPVIEREAGQGRPAFAGAGMGQPTGKL